MMTWKSEIVYHDGDSYFRDLSRALRAAFTTIDFETYIFDQDTLGKKILQELVQAAKRGVRVRLLLDGFGCSNWTHLEAEALRVAQVEVRFFHPLPWQNRHSQWWRVWTLRRVVLGLAKLNRRNHRKTCVIDGEMVFAGSMNVSARHLSRFLKLRPASHAVQTTVRKGWRDSAVCVAGEQLSQLQWAFHDAWAHARSIALPLKRLGKKLLQGELLTLNVTARQRKTAYQELIERLLGAETRIWITNPYFVPELAVIRALRFAAFSGRDVRLLLPQCSDIWIIQWAIKAFYLILLAARVRIFEYSPSVLHAKVVLIDSWGRVGSSNLNHRSLLHDLEVDVVLTHPESIKSLQDQFLTDLSVSQEIHLKAWGKRFWGARILGRLLLVLRRWM